MKLTKYEKETIVLFNEADEEAHIPDLQTPDCESVWKRSARSTQNCADWTSEWSKAACPI